jgi:hypothetical protein
VVLRDFLSVADKGTFVETLNAFETTQLIRALRYAPYASTEAKVATLEPVALVGLRRFPTNRFILATGSAALLDCGQVTTVMGTLAAQRNLVSDSMHLMRVLGKALHMRGSRRSRDVAFRLAEDMKTRPLAGSEVAWLHERLDDPHNQVPDFFEPWPQGPQALERPERFEGVLQVPNLLGYSVRMVASKTQIERFANRLRNCLNSMTDRVLADQTRIIGIERDGHPYEAIEVNPRGGLVRQWKGERNREADPATRGAIERFLLGIGAIRARRQGGAAW